MNEEINGGSVIGSVLLPDGDSRLLLTEHFRTSYGDSYLVYVVSTAPAGPTDSWYSGHYFDSLNSRRNKTEARAEFLARLTSAFAA